MNHLNEKLVSVEGLIKTQTEKFNDKQLQQQQARGGAPAGSEGEDEDFEFRIKVMPRELLEKQLKRYKTALEHEKKAVEELEEEKMVLEEELMQAKLALGEKELELSTLQAGKEAMEIYVSELAEEMENETTQVTFGRWLYLVCCVCIIVVDSGAGC